MAEPDCAVGCKVQGYRSGNSQEIFVKKDGTLTYTFDYKDEVEVGDSRPTLEGVWATRSIIKDGLRACNCVIASALMYSILLCLTRLRTYLQEVLQQTKTGGHCIIVGKNRAIRLNSRVFPLTEFNSDVFAFCHEGKLSFN